MNAQALAHRRQGQGRVAGYEARRPEMEGLPTGARREAMPAVVAVGVLLAVAFVWVMLTGSYDQYAAALIAGIMIIATIPIARHAAKVEQWPALSKLIMAAMILRIGGSLARYLVAYGAYGGVADASTYTQVANTHFEAFRQFHLFAPTTGVFNGFVPWLDTVVYAIFGPTEVGAFFIFSWLSFLGCYLFYRAFRIGYPEGDGRWYAALVFFLPSLLYWPSSLGKEAWMMLAIGLACYGLARALASRPFGYISLLAGIGGMLLVRPHLALIFLPAAILAFVLRRARPGMRRRPIGRIVGIVVLAVSSLVVVSKAQSYLGITSLDVQTVTKQLQTTRVQTDLGNSAFNPPNAQSPVGFPEAVVTVLFRPFPFEAHGLTVLVASMEGILLIGLTVKSRHRLARLPRALRQNPYVLFCLLYSLLFIFAFSNFSNFGILARERVQMLPLFLALLALPAPVILDAAASPLTGMTARQGRRSRRSPETKRQLRPYGNVPGVRGTGGTSTSFRRYQRVPQSFAGSYRALGFSFDVRVAAPLAVELVPDVRKAFEGLAVQLPADHRYLVSAVPSDPTVVRLQCDGKPIGGEVRPEDLFVVLTTDINQRAIASRPNRLTVHAGAVSVRGRAILLPGPSGAGKTTLTAALLSVGCDYLTDEAVSIDLETLEVEPYAKPLSLDADACEALGLEVDEWAARRVVPPSYLRRLATPAPAKAAVIVFPRFEPGARARMKPLGRAEALVELANNSFNFVDHGGEWLGGLARLVGSCRCWRFTTGDAREAARMMVASGDDVRSGEAKR